MRVADNMKARNFLTSIQDLQQRLLRRNREVATGVKLNAPSDDPGGSSRVLRIRDELSRINQYYRNIQQARVLLSTSDDALNSIRNTVNSISEKVSYGINGTLSQKERDTIATEIDQSLANLVKISDTAVDGKRVFSGSQVTTSPLAQVGGSYVYQGDKIVHEIQIAENQTVSVNVPGSEVFTASGADLVNTVKQASDALRAGDTTLAQSLLGDLQKAADAVDLSRVKISVSLGELDSTKKGLDQSLTSLTAEASNIEDANLAESISALTQDETALKAALESGARSQQPSLFDIIG